MQTKKQIFILLVTAFFLLAPMLSFAQSNASLDGLNITAGQAGLPITSASETPADNLNQIIGTIINAVLSFTGVIFLVLIISAGEMWLTAGGNSDQTEKARTLITNATIGIVIVFAAYLITNFAVPFVLQYTGIN